MKGLLGLAQRENDRREERGIWAGHSKRIVGPPDSGSSTSGSYVVSCTDARPSPPTHFLPSAASSPSHLPAGHGKNSAAPERTFRSALVAAEWRGPTSELSKGGAGDLGGALEENC